MEITRHIIACSLFLTVWLCGQAELHSQPVLPSPFELPKSPNAASLEKYGEIPTSLFTGQVDLSIPLYTLVEGDIELPISLSYSNTGLKLREIPSWVGHGWDLQAGGVISCSIQGFPDMSTQGILNTNAKQDFMRCYNGQMTVNERLAYFQRVADGVEDAEHDIYSYNFMGRTGRFYIDFSGNCVSIPKNALHISYTLVQGVPVFTIVDEEGFIYRFENKEGSNATNYDALLFSNFYNQSAGVGYVLTKITSSKGYYLDFVYKTASISYVEHKETYTKSLLTEGGQCINSSDPNDVATINIDMTTALLERIEFPNGKITFTSETIRQDLLSAGYSSNSPSLDGILVENSAGKDIQDIRFVHEYFGTNARLKLKRVEFMQPGTSSVDKRYEFTYHKETSANYPSLANEYSMDHWGYYNGASNNTLLIPSLMKEFSSLGPSASGDANRTARSTYSIQGMLKEVIYPTGGSTLFEYEPNQFGYTSYETVPIALRPGLANAIEYETILDLQARCGGPDYGIGQDLAADFTIEPGRDKFVSISWATGINDPGAGAAYAGIDGVTRNYPCDESSSITYDPYYASSNGSCVKDLSPGIYHAVASALTMDPQYYTGYAWVHVAVRKPLPRVLLEVGGLRLSRMTTTPQMGQPPIVKRYFYDTLGAALRIVPKYDNIFEREVLLGSTASGGSCEQCSNGITIYGDNLISKQGHLIEYSRVTELLGENGENGSIVHEFNNTSDVGGLNFPFTPSFSVDWAAGKPRTNEYFQKSEPSARVMKETFQYEGGDYNGYSSFDQNLKVGRKKMLLCLACLDGFCSEGNATFALGYMASEFVPLITEYYNLKKKEVTRYEGGQEESSLTSATEYFYEGANKAFVSKEISHNSNDEEIITLYTYPQDVTYTGDAEAARQKLVQENRTASLLERKIMQGSKQISRNTATYGLFNGMALPVVLEEQNGTSQQRSRYIFHSYDQRGNVLQEGKEDDVQTVYLFGYNGRYPVAKIEHADDAMVSAKLAEIGLNLAAVNALTDENTIKEKMLLLKTKLPQAAVTIFTHEPLRGLAFSMDPNDIVTHYEYDEVGRLSCIKDDNEDVIKSFSYHYGPLSSNILTQTARVEGLKDPALLSGETVESVERSIAYFDGLGRLVQTVVWQGSPQKNDVVQHLAYDAFGREAIRYRPYVSAETNGGYKDGAVSSGGNYNGSPHYDFYNNANTEVVRDAKPYSKNMFEASPLNRVLQQGASGEAWQPGTSPETDHSIKKQYAFNKENEVIAFRFDEITEQFSFTENGLIKYYDPGQLYANKTFDEHNNETIEFLDKDDKIVLKKVQYGEEGGISLYAETYYVYDDFGNLVMVLSPEATQKIVNASRY